jgi:hypothetical protein
MFYHLVVKEPTIAMFVYPNKHKIMTPNLVHHLTWTLLILEDPLTSTAMAVVLMAIAGEIEISEPA